MQIDLLGACNLDARVAMMSMGFYSGLTRESTKNIGTGAEAYFVPSANAIAKNISFTEPYPDEYVIKRGDTLWTIARLTYQDGFFCDASISEIVEALKAWNPGLDPQNLKSGQVLRRSPPETQSAGSPAIPYVSYDENLFERRDGYMQAIAQQKDHNNRVVEMEEERCDAEGRVMSADNFNSKVKNKSPSGAGWAYPTARDARIDMLRWADGGALSPAQEAFAGLEFAGKIKLQTVDRDDAMYRGRSGNWRAVHGGSRASGWIDRAIESVPWVKRFNEKYGGFAISAGFKPARVSAGRPDVQGDGHIATEAPRWEVEFKVGPVLEHGRGALDDVMMAALGPNTASAGRLQALNGRIAKLPLPILKKISVQYSDYLAYDGVGPLQFYKPDNGGQEVTRGDLGRMGLKHPLPFKVLGLDTAIKMRFNTHGEFLGFDLQVYNKQLDENALELVSKKFPSLKPLTRMLGTIRGVPELSMESGFNLPMRIYQDLNGNWYMRFPGLNGVLRLFGDDNAGLKPLLVGLGIEPEVDGNIHTEPDVNFKDIAYIELPGIPDGLLDIMDQAGDYLNQPRGAAVAHITTAIGGGSEQDRARAYGELSTAMDAVASSNPLQGGSPRRLKGAIKDWASDDQFRGEDAAGWIQQNQTAERLLDWLEPAFRSYSLDPFHAYYSFAEVRYSGGQHTMHESATPAQEQRIKDRYKGIASEVIRTDAVLGFMDAVHTSLREYALLQPAEYVQSPEHMQQLLYQAKCDLPKDKYQAMLTDLANPGVDMGVGDWAEINEALYGFGQHLRVPQDGVWLMKGRYLWDQTSDKTLGPIVGTSESGDYNPDAPQPLTAFQAEQIWKMDPEKAAFSINQILKSGRAGGFQLMKLLKETQPELNDLKTVSWANLAFTVQQPVVGGQPVKPNDGTKALALVLNLNTHLDAWRNLAGQDGLTLPPVKDWKDVSPFLDQARQVYAERNQMHIYWSQVDKMARALGPSGLEFGNADLAMRMKRMGFSGEDNEILKQYVYNAPRA